MLYDSVCTYLFSVVKESPPHTRWSGGMEDLRREKWIRDEKFVSGRGECVCAKLCGLGGEDVADLRFELGVKRSAAESDLVLGVSHMLNPRSVLEKSRALPRSTVV